MSRFKVKWTKYIWASISSIWLNQRFISKINIILFTFHILINLRHKIELLVEFDLSCF